MYSRIIVVDPSLQNVFSHNFRYVKTLQDKFPNTAFEVFCAKHFSGEFEGLQTHKFFDVNMYDEYAFVHDAHFPQQTKAWDPRVQLVAGMMNDIDLPGNFLGHIAVGTIRFFRKINSIASRFFKLNRAEYQAKDKLASQLFDALNQANLTEQDLVIFPTALGSLIESLLSVRLLNGYAEFPASAAYVFHFDHKLFSNCYQAFAPKQGDKRIVENLPFKSNLLCVTNERLSNRFKEELNIDALTIRDLVSDESICNENNQTDKCNANENRKVLIPGRYMWDKNFELIPKILLQLADKEYRVTVHSSALQHIQLDESLLDHIDVYEDIHGDNDWLNFLASFEAIIIPYGEYYRYRISGILSEAKQLNIPCLVSNVAADSLRVNESLVYSDVSNISVILANLHEEKENIEPYFIEDSFDVFSEAICKPELFTNSINKPIAVQIKPAWTRCGSSMVFDNQVEYLNDKGYFVVEVLVKNIFWDRTKDQVAEAYNVLIENRRYFGGAIAYFIRPNPSLLNLFDWLLNAKTLLTSRPIGRYHYLMGSMGLPTALKKLVKSNPPELVVCNHVYHLGLAKRLNGQKTVCETHDIQSRQYQIRGELPDEFAYNQSINEELNILRSQADALVNISGYEHFFFESRVNKPNFLCKPYKSNSPISAKYSELERLLQDNIEQELFSALPKELGSYIDMFFVGDAHEANIQSLTWIVEDVLPLVPCKKLFVGGTISKYLAKAYPEHEQLVHLGYIKSLSNIYDFVHVALLPDVEGAGIPIKTIEVLASNCAFSSTSKALRGFDFAKYQFQPTDNAESFAEDIMLLLSDIDFREQRIQIAKKMKKEFSKESYQTEWDKVLASL